MTADAQIGIAGHRLTDPEDARTRLQSISDMVSLLQARVEYCLQQVAIREGNLDQAEHHCRRLLFWNTDPSRIPKESLTKAEVDCLVNTSGASMVQQIACEHWKIPVTERKARIRRLMKDFPYQAIQRQGFRELERLGSAEPSTEAE